MCLYVCPHSSASLGCVCNELNLPARSLLLSKGFQLTDVVKKLSFPSYSLFFLASPNVQPFLSKSVTDVGTVLSARCNACALVYSITSGLGVRFSRISMHDGRVHRASARLLSKPCMELQLRVSSYSMTSFLHVNGASRVFSIWHMFVHVYGACCCQLYSTSFVDTLNQPRLPSFKRTLLHSFLCELCVPWITSVSTLYTSVQGLKFNLLSSQQLVSLCFNMSTAAQGILMCICVYLVARLLY